jgi:hypothetical protein
MTGLRQLVPSLKSRLLPPGPAIRTVPFGLGAGVRLPIDFAQHTRLYLGLYEIELHRHLRALCIPGIRSFDVGAQIGYDALVLARMTRAPVMSFEADERLIPALRQTFAANTALAGHLHVRHGFVGNANSAADNVVSLDDVAYKDGFVPGLMKIDIDGGEVEALHGAARILRDARPHLIIETHSLALERACGDLLVEAGYTPRIVHQRRIWPDYRPTDHNRWLVAVGAPHLSAFATTE